MDRFRTPRQGVHREVRFDRIRDVRIDRYNGGIDKYGDNREMSGDLQWPDYSDGDLKGNRNGDFQIPERNGNVNNNRNGDIGRNDVDVQRIDRKRVVTRDINRDIQVIDRNGDPRIEDLGEIRVDRNSDIRACTMPAFTQEAPPVIRREKNKKDNSANRRSRPASWFVSHFSFDKLFHRGKYYTGNALYV